MGSQTTQASVRKVLWILQGVFYLRENFPDAVVVAFWSLVSLFWLKYWQYYLLEQLLKLL